MMEYACQFLLHRFETALDGTLNHLPFQPWIRALRFVVMPLGKRWAEPGDDLVRKIARDISTDAEARHLLLTGTAQTQSTEKGAVHNALAQYNGLLKDYERAETIYRTLRKAQAKKQVPITALHPEQVMAEAHKAGLINDMDQAFMQDFEARVLGMISVDDFDFKEVQVGRVSQS